ncbi:hypothetical protein [Roseivirga sp.]|uniref:hypothetical protein n=1 Tax=Roseivirga sp. TaxID=1964215 RepID=UPI002B272982|nr:hypothetical protein [Roseivirga sp.]
MTNLQNSLERLRTLANDLPENQKSVILDSIQDIHNTWRISHHVEEHIESLRQSCINKNITAKGERTIRHYMALASRFKEQEQSNFQEFITALKKEFALNEKERDYWKEQFLGIRGELSTTTTE